MNRRESLKALGLTAVSTGVLLEACKPGEEKKTEKAATGEETPPGRQPFESERDKRLNSYKFFSEHELATIGVLADIIIPRDEKSGSATDAKVPDFIEFIVKDMPGHQVPVRGGLKWLDVQCLNQFGKTFRDADEKQRIEMVEDIAYPGKVKPGMEPGVSFFSLMRNLTASGFYTSEIGIKDIGYMGNQPNRWEGVPADVLKQYGMEHV
ncbi:gluconate 2-dehydrogenase subunit 3 family protein [Pedobacter sp. JY14-1]|uniref:gluconate 2-dehydrogenase subunit 3 family protein n=1 Tax=Pedobacter sp. JY14-1 TaxID=3034151 RepID=UPI0023E18E9E|nr:gluconate 2-dehydrogenase subunit 3 family protein [Pedobacter sp. JY14-1]